MESAYELFRNGTRLLEDGDHHAAVVALTRARDLEPDKDSIHEALGRALFHCRRYREAADEFAAIVDHAPTNDYALLLPRPRRCSFRASTPRPATRWPWPRRCGRGGRTTGATATRRGGGRRRRPRRRRNSIT